VISFLGLSLTETPHRLELGDLALYAWCALDALFLPRLIGRTTRVRSVCGQTGEPVSLTVSPDSVEELSPTGALVSMLVPEHGFGDDVIESFCHHVHFFTGREAGERWLTERQSDDAFLLTVDKGVQLGLMWTRHLLGEVESA
jgi:alkylmercury lyase